MPLPCLFMVNPSTVCEDCSEKSCLRIVLDEEQRLLKIICMGDKAVIRLLATVSNGFPLHRVPWAAAELYCHFIVVRICLGGTKSLSLEFSLPVLSSRYISFTLNLRFIRHIHWVK